MPETVLVRGAVLTGGVAAGKVCLYQEDLLEAAPRYFLEDGQAEKEIERFRGSREKTKQELRAIYERVSASLSTLEAEVFNTHLIILDDVTFVAEIEQLIRDRKMNAESAIVDTLHAYEDKFEALPNHYFRERIQDVSDIARRLIANLGLEHKGFQCATCHSAPGIVAASNLTSTLMAGLHDKKISAIIAEKGSAISHAAILARAMGIPVMINVENLISLLGCGTEVIVDAEKGEIHISPDESLLADYRKKMEKAPAKEEYRRGYIATKDGVRIKLFANAGALSDAVHAKEHNVRDIGLFRTEFLFLDRDTEPTVQEQTEVYREIIDAVDGTVTFRLLDIGGDKILDFLTLPDQENPGLGLRGARIYDLYPGLIDRQIESLLAARGKRPMNILIPMVSTVREFGSAKARILKKAAEMRKADAAEAGSLKIGCMIEVPSAVYLIRYLYEEADFLSIGTNDLIQYIMGVDRNNDRLADLSSPFQPAVLKVLKEIAATIGHGEKETVVCGEIASDPAMVRVLAGLGYRNLSINVHAIDTLEESVSAFTMRELEAKASSLLSGRTLEHIVDLFKA